jgi:hypothetical protein
MSCGGKKPPSEALFDIFEEKMSEMCSVTPSGHSKSIVTEEWWGYLDSLAPSVESIRPSVACKGFQVAVRKRGNIPVLNLLVDRINSGDFDCIVIEDPAISSSHIPTWGPNLILVDRVFADKVLLLGELP